METTSTNTQRHVRMSRRVFLKGAGATAILASGGVVWRAVDQDVINPRDGAAYEPWHDWNDPETPGPTALVSAAILAANAHNTQPWLFQVTPSQIDLFADASRSIGTVDPYARERDISLGCALENMLLAAPAHGYAAGVSLMPDPANSAHMARVSLMPGATESTKLYEAIPHRHTNRYAYDTDHPVTPETIGALDSLADDEAVRIFWFTGEDARRTVTDLLVESAKTMNEDKAQASDNVQLWLRQDQDAINRHRDGLTLDTLGLSRFELIAGKMLPSSSLSCANASFDDSEKRNAESAGAFGILAVQDAADAGSRLRVGRLWQRMHLWLTQAGLAAQPMNQIHERVDREVHLEIKPRFSDALTNLLDDPAWQGMFTFRLGFSSKQAPPSPRRPVTDVALTGTAQ